MRSRAVLVLVVGVSLYALLGFFAVPPLLERQLTHFTTEQLQRRASIGKTTFNPFLFKLEIKDFALSEKGGAPIVGFQRLFVDLELSGVLHWAWTLADVTIDGLDLRADVRPDGRLNLAILADSFPKSEKKSGSLPRFVLQHAALNNGTIVFSDHSDPTPASMTVKPINLELRDISTLPEHRGPYSVRATIPGGGSLGWRGEVSLQPVYSRGELSLKGFSTATVWKFLQDEFKFAEPSGHVDFDARYAFSFAESVPRLTIEGIRSKLTGLALTKRGAERPLLKLDEVEVADGRFDLGKRELVLPLIAVRRGATSAVVDEGGVIDWQTVVTAADRRQAAPPRAEEAKARPWHVKVQAVRIEDIALDYQDRSRAVPLDLTVDAASAACSAAIDIGTPKAGAVISNLKVSISKLKLSGDKSEVPLIALESAVLEGGNVDLGERKLAIQQVTVRGGASTIVREAGGGIPLLDAMRTNTPGTANSKATAVPAGAEGAPWTIELAQFNAEDLRIALADRVQSPAIAYDVTGMRLSAKDFRNDGNTPIKVDGSLRVVQGGTAAISGTVSPSGDRLAARFKLERLNLKPLQSLVAARAALELESANLSTEVQVSYQAGKKRTEVRVKGPARIDNLLLKEASTGERFLAWRALSTPQFDLSLAPDQLRIDELRVVEPYAKIVIFKDRSVNLAKILKSQGAPAGGVEKLEKPPGDLTQPAGAGPKQDFPVTIGRIRAEQGTVDFADNSLVLPFATKVQELGGEASGISFGQPTRTALNFEGRVEEYGLARAEGSLNAADPKAFTDIRVTFRNVDMPPLSPYTVTFAGRKIASGKLALDLHYKIENGELAGDNSVALERFTLGERVKTPGALDLPLDLAVALLTDADGRINIAVPVRGNVDRPEFSYGDLISQAIGSLIKRIVTAPFRALAALFGGGGGEELDRIAFDPGRAALLPPEREKLKRIAAVLGKRPQLKLVIQGEYAESDRQALQRRAARRTVAAKMGRTLSPDEDPGQPNVADAKTQRALEAVYVERTGEQALTQFARSLGEKRGQPVQRVNPVLGLLGRASPDASFYEALLGRIAETTEVPNASLQKLANDRAQEVTNNLLKVNTISPGRLRQTPAPSDAAGGSAPQVKFSFDAVREAGN